MAGAAAAVFAAPPISPSTPPTVPKRNLPLHFLSPSPPSTRRSRVRPLLVAASLESNLVSSLRERWMDFANLNCWVVRDYRRFVDSVNSLEPHVSRLSEEQLAAKTHEFRLRVRDGETLADIQAGREVQFLVSNFLLLYLHEKNEIFVGFGWHARGLLSCTGSCRKETRNASFRCSG